MSIITQAARTIVTGLLRDTPKEEIARSLLHIVSSVRKAAGATIPFLGTLLAEQPDRKLSEQLSVRMGRVEDISEFVSLIREKNDWNLVKLINAAVTLILFLKIFQRLWHNERPSPYLNALMGAGLVNCCFALITNAFNFRHNAQQIPCYEAGNTECANWLG